MKTIKAKQQFKSVTAAQVEKFPVLADRLGKRRTQVEFSLPQWETADLPQLVESNGAILLTCLNNALADLAKAKFAANNLDWSYVPSEDDLSLAALAASFESTSRGRILTNENAGKLVAWIQANAAALVAGIQSADANYSATQLQSICVVLSQFTAYASKQQSVLDKVILRMEQISEAIMANEFLADSFVEDSSLAEVYDALIKKFTRADEIEITADAL